MAELYPYQRVGVPWLAARLTALLADEMGLGKSVQAIRAADQLDLARVLVICPASLREDWRAKFEEWARTRRPTHVLAPKSKVHLGGPAYNLIVGYEGAVEHRQALRSLPWDLIILDEAQLCKNPAARRTRAIYGGYCDGFSGIIAAARRVWALSGTPMLRDVRDLYPHLKALRPASIIDPNTGMPMMPAAFTDRYAVLDPVLGEKVVANRNVEELSGVLDGFMLRRTVEEALPELPELRFVNLYVKPDTAAAELAADHWPELQAEMAQLLAAARDDDVSWAMQQQISTVRRLTGLVKAPMAAQLLKGEFASGALDQVVVFAHHREVLETIAHGLQTHWGCGLLYGGQGDAERDWVVRAFQGGKLRALAIQIQAGGVGLTLTAAHQVLFVESSWNPTDNWQAAARCRRIGQKYPVLARFMTLTGTIDEPIQRVAVRKATQIKEVLTR